MLATSVGITGSTSIGGGQYTISLFFQSAVDAKFVRVGDTVQDASANQYEVVTWSTYPTDFASGGSMTVQFITTDVAPGNDAGFFSTIFTPGQVDVRPAVRTDGNIFNITFLSGQLLEYEARANWVLNAEASKAQVGDRIVDSTGKEYEISLLTGNLFDDPFRIREIEAEGITPVAGSATLYRSTPSLAFFQGNALSDPARTVIFNRDKFLIDQQLSSISSQAVTAPYLNNTGGSIQALTVVMQDALGNMTPLTDLSDDAQVKNILGVLGNATSNGLEGTVTMGGLLKDITTAFALEVVLYLDTDGTLTSTIPEIGAGTFTAGDHVVKIGQITKNADNPADRDLLIDIVWEGTL